MPGSEEQHLLSLAVQYLKGELSLNSHQDKADQFPAIDFNDLIKHHLETEQQNEFGFLANPIIKFISELFSR